jgi:hypothetical protein
MSQILPGLSVIFLGWLLNPYGQFAAQQWQRQGKSRPPASTSVSQKKQVRETQEQDQKDEKILRDVSNAAAQAASWTDAWMLDILSHAQGGSDVRKGNCDLGPH